MDIKYHITFKNEKNPELTDYLEQNNISYDKDLNLFDMYESSEHWKFIKDFVLREDNSEKDGITCLANTIFTKGELKNADWLRMRTKWRNDYPQPEDSFSTITYSDEHCCDECGCGLEQVDAFRIKRVPKWGKRRFMTLNWIDEELFVNDFTKEIFEKSEFKDISFKEVKNKRGTEVIPDVWQLVTPTWSKTGIIEQQRCITGVLKCSKCGTKIYHPNGMGMMQYKKGTFENAPDIFKTDEYFGWFYTIKRIIISQKMYRFITEHHLEASLVFEPIDLV